MPMGLNILLVFLYFVYLSLTIVMIVFYALIVSRQINMAKPKIPSSIKNQPVTSETPKTPGETDNQL